MTGRWANKDLIGQTGGHQSGGRPWGPLVGVLAIGAVIGAAVWWWGDDAVVEEDRSVEEAIGVAGGDLSSGIEAARHIVESGEAQDIVEQRRLERARDAEWSEGQETLLAGEVAPDESIYVTMAQRGVPQGSVHRVISATEEVFDFRRSRPGDQWWADVDEQGRIEEFRYETSPEDIWVTRYDEDDEEYEATEKEVDVDVRTRSVAGEVEGSFWLSISRRGESDILAHRFMEVFEYTLDFNTESRDGDHYAMQFEEIYLDDEFLRHGRILGAKYIGRRGTFDAYYFESDDESGYFDADGESLQRQFLRSPLEVTRVTSGFGRREHPITGDNRMHRGVDYGAPTGTPVQAVADGEVVYAGWNGGYGNLLRIRHRGGYETRYAHLSEFSSGISPGTRVSQGQIVARSGNTGASTAPHLHYEMLRDGHHIDPLEVDTTDGEPLPEQYRADFDNDIVEPRSEKLVEMLDEEAPAVAEDLREDELAEEDADRQASE